MGPDLMSFVTDLFQSALCTEMCGDVELIIRTVNFVSGGESFNSFVIMRKFIML